MSAPVMMNPQRFLALAGLGSRRACEELIRDGRVTLNGAALTFGMKVGESDEVRVDGKLVRAAARLHYIAMNKPAGLISDRGDPRAQSALDLAGLPAGLHAVGRLDKDATGLLLLTNDGELSFRLSHPSFEHDKEYRVLVDGRPNRDTLSRWEHGVDLDGERTAAARVTILRASADSSWLRVVLHEGRKRQIKRIAKALGHPVRELSRVRIGPLELGDIPIGRWRPLTAAELQSLLRVSGRAVHHENRN